MSGFLLAWARRGTLDPRAADAAVPFLRRRGPHGITRIVRPDVIAVHARFDDGADGGDLPIEEGGWVLAADARVDDQSRLRARLRDAGEEPPPGSSDAQLLLAALRAWGPRAMERVLGDFALAALDRRRGMLLASRSMFGVKGLFTVETPSVVACSNDLDALCQLPGVDRAPDEAALVEFLRAGGPVLAERTARAGVRRVPGSETRLWSAQGRPEAVRHDLLPQPPRTRLVSEAEYVASFRERLDDAVADRLRAPRAAVMLSGGLDSPAVAASASRARPGVLCLALTSSMEPLLPDDEPLLARGVAGRLGIPHEVTRVGSSIAMAHCDDPSLHTPEPLDAPDLPLWRRQVGRLAEEAPLTLHGEDGDAVLAPPDLVTMLRTIPPLTLVRDWTAYRMEHGTAPWSGLRELARGPLSRRRREAAEWAAPGWVRRAVVQRHGERPPPHRSRHRTRPQAAAALRSTDWESFVMLLDAGATGLAHAFALPLLDLRVIEFAFAIPPIPWLQRKWLLRRAFRGVLPDEVLGRPKSPLHGYREALVARWRASGGAERALPTPMDDLVDVRAWREVLRGSADAERVMEAWRVFELSRWLSQRGAA